MRTFGEDSPRSRVNREPEPDMDRLMQEKDGAIDRALQQAVREALLRHKKLGQSVIIGDVDNLIELPPEKIPD